MTTIFYFLPFLISYLLGLYTTKLIFSKEKTPSFPILFIFSLALGLSLSAFLTFLSFIIFNRLHHLFVIILNLIVLGAFIVLFYRSFPPDRHSFSITKKDIYLFLSLWIVTLPVLCIYARFYPEGGWDAWAVWNFKAKFLFLAGDEWQNMFSPILWRSSPHYPLLLPLINVWGWLFLKEPALIIPMITAVLFTVMTIGILAFGLKELTKTHISFLAGFVLLTIPFYLTLATSQYADIVLGFFALSSLWCLIKVKLENSQGYALLSGIFLGVLGFTKPEGLVASLLIAILSIPYLVWQNKLKDKKNVLTSFFLAFFFCSLPTIAFSLFFASPNITFINGLASSAKPSDMERLWAILQFFPQELTSRKWQGIWLITFAGILLGRKKLFSPHLILIPFFLFSYLGITILYYLLNTYFEINWWLEMTLNRILFSLLPAVLFWVMASLWAGNIRDRHYLNEK